MTPNSCSAALEPLYYKVYPLFISVILQYRIPPCPFCCISLLLVMQASATIVHNLKAHTDEVARLSFSPDGKILAAHDDSILTLWDMKTGSLLSRSEDVDDMYFEMAFSPDSKRIAAASDDGIARIWNARTGELQRMVKVEDERMLSLAFSPDSKLLATGSEVLRVWEVETGELLHTLLDPGVHPLSITSVCEGGQYPAEIFTVAFSGDGKLLVSACPDTLTACIWNTESWTLEHTIQGYTVSFSPDGKYAVIPSNKYRTIQIYDTSTWQLQSTLETNGRQVYPSIISPDSKIIATIAGRETELWDVNDGKAMKLFTDPARQVSTLAFSPDRRVLISGAKKCSLRVWDLESGDCLLILEHEDGVRDPWNVNGVRCDPPAMEVTFADGGAKVAVAFPDESVRIWDVKWNVT
jgi:WD40 repeat protein